MRKGIKIISAALLAVLMVSVLGLSALALKSDYSKPGATGLTELSAPAVLEGVFGIELSEAEESYLKLYDDYQLVYGSNIPASYVTVIHEPAAGTLTVIAKDYSYVASNGVSVSWRPMSAILYSEEKELVKTEQGYTATFAFDGSDTEGAVSISYSTELSVSASVLNELLNKAYNDAAQWKLLIAEAQAEYEAALQKYKQDSESYSTYLSALEDYKTNLALYNAYLTAKRIYAERLAEYKEYLEDYAEYEVAYSRFEAYEQAMQKYNSDYALYDKYLTDKANYEKNLALYNLYVENYKKVVAQLAIIDGTKSYSTSLKRSVYDAIIGGTVTKVIDNKDAIANSATGVDGAIVDAAGLATENIRALYGAYFALGSEEEKYTYYALNYESWRDNFCNLFRALDKLYTYPEVRFALGEYGIQTKYEILLAQLYYVSNAISDQPVKNYDNNAVYNSSYVINSLTGIKPLGRLDNKPYMVDTGSATPLEGGYPKPVEEPVLTEVEKPVKPDLVTRPTEPDAVDNPGEPPEEVKKPTEPEAVSAPGAEPTPYTPTDEVKAIIAAYDGGELSLREETAGARKIKATVTINKKIFNSQLCTVVFKDCDGSLLDSVEVEKGTYAEYSGRLPVKAEDKAATYAFAGWQDADGNIRSLEAVEDSMELYPAFIPTYKSYNVTWIVGESTYTEQVLYGTVPEYDGTPTLPDADNREYLFTGWDKEPAAVESNATYVAAFAVRYIVTLSDGTGAAFSYTDEGDLTVDMGKSYDTEIDLSGILPRLAERGALTVKSRLYTLNFSFSDVIAMHGAGITSARVNTVRSGSGNRFSVELLSSQRTATEPLRASLTVKCDVSDPDAFTVYTLNDGTRVPVSYKLKDGYITLTCQSGVTYYTAVEYTVNLLPSAPVTLTVSGESFGVGDTVRVNAGAPVGVRVDGVYVIDREGNKTYLTGDSFAMCEGGVSVGVDYHYLTYTVSFLSDGKVISTAEYRYGELPTEPPRPEKAADGIYTYSFVGWSTAITEVTGNATYTAVYRSTLIPKKDTDGLQITDGVLNIIVTVFVLVGYAVLVILPVAAVSVVGLVRRKRRKLPKKAE